jgi:dimethylamine/trimethylamine dehydrogenase
VFTGRAESFAAEAVVLVTARLPENELTLSLQAKRDAWGGAGIASVTTIGDALAPGTIAAAVFSGRRVAEEMDGAPIGDAVPFRREVTALQEGWRP